MDSVVTDTNRTALLPVACDAVSHLAEASRLLEVDVNQVAEPFPFVALKMRLGFQVLQPAQAQAIERSGHGGEGSREQPGDVTLVEPLIAQLNSALQMLRIKRPPLGAANAAPIRQRGWTT